MTEPQILNIIAIFIAFVAPVVTARVTSPDARKLIKIGVCLAVSGVAGLVAAYGQYESGVTDWAVLAMAAFGFAQLAYKAADSAYEKATGAGINEQEWASPDRGLD